MPVEPDTTSMVEPETNTSPPPQPVRSAGDLLPTLDPGKPSKLLGHEIGLQPPLRRKRDVLPVTASTSSGACVGTRRRHTIRGGMDDLERVCSEVRLRLL